MEGAGSCHERLTHFNDWTPLVRVRLVVRLLLLTGISVQVLSARVAGGASQSEVFQAFIFPDSSM